MADRSSWVQSLRANAHTIHDAAAPKDAKGILQVGESFLRRGVSTVCDEPIGLKQSCRTYELVWVPPETGAGSRAASTQDAFIQTV